MSKNLRSISFALLLGLLAGVAQADDAAVIARARKFAQSMQLAFPAKVRTSRVGDLGLLGVSGGGLYAIVNPDTLEICLFRNSSNQRLRWQRREFAPYKNSDSAWFSYAEDFLRRGWPHLTVRRGNIKYNRYKDMLDSTARTVVMNMLVTAPANSELVRLSICFDLDDGTFMGVLGEPRVKRSNRRTGGPLKGGGR